MFKPKENMLYRILGKIKELEVIQDKIGEKTV